MKVQAMKILSRLLLAITFEPKTHDYTQRAWGHDYTFKTKDKGLTAKMEGWGYGISKGDFLLLPHKGNSGNTRFQVRKIEYSSRVPDMWFADVNFAPRD